MREPNEPDAADLADAEAARDWVERRVRRRRVVSSVAIGRLPEGDLAVVVGVVKQPLRSLALPDSHDGVPIRVVEDGPITALTG